MKFTTTDTRYFAKREQFAQDYPTLSLFDIADHWPLYAGTMNIARQLAIYDLLKQALEVPGHLCELGVWHGSNLLFMAKVCQILQPHSLREVYGFDTFGGLADGRYRGDEGRLRDAMEMVGLSEMVQLVKGDISDTLPRFLTARPDAMFCCVSFDADDYLPTKAGLDLLMERVPKGGVLIFDQYNCAGHPGETLAVREVLARYPLKAVAGTRQPTAAAVVA